MVMQTVTPRGLRGSLFQDDEQAAAARAAAAKHGLHDAFQTITHVPIPAAAAGKHSLHDPFHSYVPVLPPPPGAVAAMAAPPQHKRGASSSSLILFTYEDLIEATNGFSASNLIGEGGFGCVFRGSIAGGQQAVAIKRLRPGGGQGEREFRAEMETISRVHHRHLVSLVGYCHAHMHRILVYEFVPNGTLDQHLHRKQSFCTWLYLVNSLQSADPNRRRDSGVNPVVVEIMWCHPCFTRNQFKALGELVDSINPKR
jgi:hypothetical protein